MCSTVTAMVMSPRRWWVSVTGSAGCGADRPPDLGAELQRIGGVVRADQVVLADGQGQRLVVLGDVAARAAVAHVDVVVTARRARRRRTGRRRAPAARPGRSSRPVDRRPGRRPPPRRRPARRTGRRRSRRPGRPGQIPLRATASYSCGNVTAHHRSTSGSAEPRRGCRATGRSPTVRYSTCSGAAAVRATPAARPPPAGCGPVRPPSAAGARRWPGPGLVVRGGQHRGDLRHRHVQQPQPADQLCLLHLAGGVPPVAGGVDRAGLSRPTSW